ncbi:ACP synthase [Cephaloticoccus primus]|uniref:Holo-[acyl-carrier-protein] synthase n=1 Tax=Cephaloticoccus primus TaxID=1548207 RepID=A0A139SLI5_9BACT|nr:holo-ACP synthase [Cephaloticoccus primus]KXU35421.1 ACP synthase [Cephaloticoccus primus]
MSARLPAASFGFSLPAGGRGGRLVGLGCDLVEVSRIARAIERHAERFLARTFTEEERAYCAALKYPHKHYAVRWAAKEAVAKAFTTGIGAELGWTSVGVYHGARGEPLVRLDEKGAALLRAVGGTDVLLSLSHTETHAMAVAAIVQREQGGE